MTNGSAVPDVTTLEALIGQVRGVIAARVVLDTHSQIDEIHVVGSPERSAKQTVRDIESALFVQGRIRVNHKKISLVQLLEQTIRPTIERVRLITIVDSVGTYGPIHTVTLAIGDRQVCGEYTPGTATTPILSANEQVAQATLHALSQMIVRSNRLELEHIQHQQLGQNEICLALITRIEDDLVESMLGVSIVRKDLPTAVARAVLDAVNRRLPYLLGQA